MTSTCSRLSFALALALVPLSAATAASAAEGVPAGLKVSSDKVRTDAAGAFVTVSVANATTTSFSEIVVACSFTNGSRKLGTSTTTLFSTAAGTTGSDQVRLLGATAATAAQCEITRAQ